MRWIVAREKWILLVTGALTFTMIQALFAPRPALLSAFGATLDGPVAEIVVRSWGALIALGGAGLIFSAFHPPSRTLAMLSAGGSKLVFIVLVLLYGRPIFAHQAGTFVVVDGLMVVLFAACLLGRRSA